MPQPNFCSQSHSVAWTAPSGRTYTLDLTLTYSIDRDYGADADGNRSCCAYFPEDAYIENNPFTPEVMGADYQDWQDDGPSIKSLIETAWEEADIN